MVWQDVVISVGQVVFILALLPAVRSQAKPPALTSAITAAVLYGFAITFVTLSLYGAVATSLGSAVMWTVLLAQVGRRKLGDNR